MRQKPLRCYGETRSAFLGMRSVGSSRRDLAEECHVGNTMEKSKSIKMAARIIMPKVIDEKSIRTGGKNNPHQNQDIFLREEQISPLSHKRLSLCCKLSFLLSESDISSFPPCFNLCKTDDMYQKLSQAGHISKSAQPALWLSPWQ